MKQPPPRPRLAPTPIIWQDVSVRLPPDWEMVRYGMRYERGVCAFADAYAERLHLSWERTEAQPDFDRLLSDLASEERGESRRVDRHALDPVAAWHGLVVYEGETATTRASRYFSASRTLVEVTLFWPRERDPELEQHVLDAVTVLTPGTWRTWQAFGIQADVPVALELSEFRCLPADVTWTFRGRRAFPRVCIRRLGFIDVWLKEPLSEWLQKQVKGWRVLDRGAQTAPAGHRIERLITRGRRPGWSGLITRRLTRCDFATVCPEEKRLYHVFVLSAGADRMVPGLRCSCGTVLSTGHKGVPSRFERGARTSANQEPSHHAG